MRKEKTIVIIKHVFALTAMLICGCATIGVGNCIAYSWPSEVDSIADVGADLRDKTYVITSAMQNISDEDLEFKEVAKWINNALKLKGYKQVDSKENASLLIRLAYGRGEPQTTTSTYTRAPGYSYPVGWYRYYVPSVTETVRITNFRAHLMLEVYDLKTPGKLPQVWKTTLTVPNMTEGSDLRMSFLSMIAASINDFGTNTGHKIVYVTDDPAFLALMDSLKK